MTKNKSTKVLEGMQRAAEGGEAPQKRFFRSRAHINPLSHVQTYQYPITPERMDWSPYYPAYAHQLRLPHSSADNVGVDIADVGCGFGGLLVGLGTALPDMRAIGLEIRPKVTEYVRLRILAMRKQQSTGHNLSVMCTNAMKYLPNLFVKGQLSKMFFCFPDPHFKRSNHRRRIVTTELLAEYAYTLKEGGILYTITDVLDLHNWMAAHCEAHPFFERIPDDSAELLADPCVNIMRTYTEEGQKVERNHGSKYIAVFRRISEARAVERADELDFWDPPHVAYEQILAPSQQKHLDNALAKQSGTGATAGAKRPREE